MKPEFTTFPVFHRMIHKKNLLLLLFLSCLYPVQGAEIKPNILLIITDQQTASAMSSAGNPYLHTPAIDQIAENGISFRKAYSVQPLCKPFRTSLQTGKYPHETRIMGNENVSGNPDYTLLGKAMTRAGYEVAYHGKWHVGYSGKENYEIFDGGTNDSAVASRVVSFLEQDRDKPFFLTASFTNPHDICQLARALDGREGNSLPQGPIAPFPPTEELPPLPDNFDIAEDEPAVIREIHTAQSTRSLYPTTDYDETSWRQYLWGYYRLVEKVDAEIMKVLVALQNTEQMDNTLIIFISDHGEGISAHHWNQKCILYNEVANIPCIVSLKGTTPAGFVDSTHLISPALDIYPTLLDMAGVPVPGHYDGRSLKSFIMEKGDSDWREYLVLQNVFNLYNSVSSRAIVSGGYKYIAYNKDSQPAGDQLFDMVNDPGEMKNLSRDSKYSRIESRCKNRLKSWQKHHADTGFKIPDAR